MNGMEQSVLNGLVAAALLWGPWLYLLISGFFIVRFINEEDTRDKGLLLLVFTIVVFTGMIVFRDEYRPTVRKVEIEQGPTIIESRKDLFTESIVTNKVKTLDEKVNERIERNRLENEMRKKKFEELIKANGGEDVSAE